MKHFDIVDFIEQTFSPSENETLLFMVDDSDPKRNERVEEWARAMQKAGKLRVLPVLHHKQTGRNGANLPPTGTQNGQKVSIADILKAADIVWSLPRYSATRPLFQLKDKLEFRVGSSPNFQIPMLDSVMRESPLDIQARGKILLPKVRLADGLLIEFATGHHVYFDIRNVPWEEDLGNITKGMGMALGNIPFGEICAPQHEGSLFSYLLQKDRESDARDLADFYKKYKFNGSNGKSLLRRDGTIIETETHGYIPISRNKDFWIYRIENGFVREIIGDGKTAAEQRKLLKKELFWGYIAEVAFGLNSRADKNSPYTLENEKSAIHFAIGNSAQAGGFSTPFQHKAVEHHQDYTLTSPVVAEAKLIYNHKSIVPSETIITNGKYTIFGKLNF
ncbi:MAG TPA: hypothetical protein PKW76_15815 [bacterium]|nr:hypothetical protein [bacterium]